MTNDKPKLEDMEELELIEVKPEHPIIKEYRILEEQLDETLKRIEYRKKGKPS